MNAVDGQGWYYSLDFPWIKFYPEKNTGIKKVSDFVRRRRWIRTRVRIKMDALQGLQETEKPSSKLSYFSCFNFM